MEQNEKKDCVTLETFTNELHLLELTSTTPGGPVELNTFNKVDMTPRQPEGINSANEGDLLLHLNDNSVI